MNLYENPYPMIAFGAVLFCLFVMGFMAQPHKGWFGAMAASVLLIVGAWGLDTAVETPKEAVERTLYEAGAAVARNADDEVIAMLTPRVRGNLGSMARTGFKMFEFKSVKINRPKTTVNELTTPQTAEATFYVVVHLKAKTGLFAGEKYVGRIRVQLEKHGERWLFNGVEELPPI